MPDLPRGLGNLDAIVRRYQRALERRQQWVSLYREAYDYALPSRQSFAQQAEGQQRGVELFDSIAETSVIEFASRLQANVFPSWRNWSILTPGAGLPKEQRDNSNIATFLQEQTDIFFSYLNHSNFSMRVNEACQDLAVGMGALRFDLNEAGDGFQFECIPISRLAIEEGPAGAIETTFEDRRLPTRMLSRLYGGKLQLPAEWMRRGQEEKEREFVHGILYAPKTRSYHLVVFASQPRTLLYSAPLGETSPDIVFRWSVAPGEIGGRGPVLSALPDIRTLNKVQEYMLRAAALNIAPPLTGVSDGTLNPYTAIIAPDTIIPVASNDNANPSLKPLMAAIRADLGEFVLEDLRQSVRQKLLADPRRREGPIQSATEILVEDREFIQQTGAAFGRLEAELLTRIISRGIDLLQRVGRMAKLRVDGREVAVKHTSPLSRAQDNEELMALQNFASLSAAAAGPEAYALAVKVEEIPAYVARKTGIPLELVRSRDEIAEKGQQMAAALAAAQGGQPDATAPVMRQAA